MNSKTIIALLALAAVPAAALNMPSLTAGKAIEAELATDPAAIEARAAVAQHFVPAVDAAAAARMGALADSILLTQGLPPPPGQEPRGGALPPPPGDNRGGALPPPPGGGRLPPPPGGGQLPPPPGEDPLPRPSFPGGPLPRGDHRLENAERTYSEEGQYVGYWNGSRGYTEARGEVVVSPADRSDDYTMVLKSEERQNQTHFVKQNGVVYWYPGSRYIDTETRRVTVSFVNRQQKPLLPWERESFVFTFKGDRSRNGGLVLESSNGAYRYEYSIRFDSRDSRALIVDMEAKEKLLTSPAANGVTLSLESNGAGGLKLVVTDLYASFYAGESLQIAVTVKKDSGSIWRRDAVVFDATSRSPQTLTVPAGALDNTRLEIPVNATGAGKYYINDWAFQRLNSAISRSGWINRGSGNRITL